jgi:hypothetical protein
MAGTGITAINSLTGSVQTLGVGTSGTDFAISSSGTSHTFNLPTASSSNRGALSSSDWSNFNTAYTNRITSLTTTGSSGSATLSSNTLNVPTYTLSGLGGQPLATNLTSLAGLSYASTSFVKMTAAGTFSLDTNTYLTSVGTGTTNQITYWSGTNTIAALSTATYPSLTELSYVKGVTSAIQTQINTKQATVSLTTTGSTGASTFSSNTLNIPNYSDNDDNFTKACQLLGSTVKGFNLGLPRGSTILTQNYTLVNQSVRFFAYYLPNAQTITGVKWYQVTIGSYTANNYNGVGLYTYSGGTLTLVASSTNDGTIWQTAATGTMGSKAFSSTYSASAGIYFIGILYCASAAVTVPVLAAPPSNTSANSSAFDFTNSAKLFGQASGTTLPSSQASSGLATNTVPAGVWLY